MTTRQQARLLLQAPAPEVRAALLDPTTLPRWNPAFRSLDGPTTATVIARYRLTIRQGRTGSFRYTAIKADHITMRWDVPGLAEVGTWQLRPVGQQTEVIHTFEHTGPLAALLAIAYRGVAHQRLSRLSHYLTSTLQPR